MFAGGARAIPDFATFGDALPGFHEVVSGSMSYRCEFEWTMRLVATFLGNTARYLVLYREFDNSGYENENKMRWRREQTFNGNVVCEAGQRDSRRTSVQKFACTHCKAVARLSSRFLVSSYHAL